MPTRKRPGRKRASGPPLEETERVEDVTEDDASIPYKYTITAYGADYPVDGLVQRLTSGDIVIPTFDPSYLPPSKKRARASVVVPFQRGFVWPLSQRDKFIESLLLGLPVPGIFLVREPTDRLLVLDGQQRLRTLRSFYGADPDESPRRLGSEVQARYAAKTYAELALEDRRRLDNSIIHATVVRQDKPSNDQSSIYLIFERLNTGGVKLLPQQIRVALYHGAFVTLLRALNENPHWRALYGAKSPTLKDHEIILRFFALLHDARVYARPMKTFLNDFLSSNRELKRFSAQKLERIFESTTSVLHDAVGQRAFRLEVAINVAVADAVMVGIAHRLSRGPIRNPESVRTAYDGLVKTKRFRLAVERATADAESVRTRLRLSKAAFAKAT